MPIKFSRIRNLKKAVEGFVIAGGAAEAVVQTITQGGDVDISSVEHALTVILCALVGAGYKSLVNYLKNR